LRRKGREWDRLLKSNEFKVSKKVEIMSVPSVIIAFKATNPQKRTKIIKRKKGNGRHEAST